MANPKIKITVKNTFISAYDNDIEEQEPEQPSGAGRAHYDDHLFLRSADGATTSMCSSSSSDPGPAGPSSAPGSARPGAAAAEEPSTPKGTAEASDEDRSSFSSGTDGLTGSQALSDFDPAVATELGGRLDALQAASKEERAEVARCVADALQGSVMNAARTPTGQALLLNVLDTLSAEEVGFVLDELLPSPHRLASNPHAHLVICKVIETMPNDPRTIRIVDSLLQGAAVMCCHKYGHNVGKSIVSHGVDRQRGQILAVIKEQLQRFSRHRNGSAVLTHALACGCGRLGSADGSDVLAEGLLRSSGIVTNLATHCFGSDVIRQLLLMDGARDRVISVLRRYSGRLSKSHFAAEVMVEEGFGSL